MSDLIPAFRRLGERIGYRLYRVVLYEDGRGELEFETPNPIECAVIRWSDHSGLMALLDDIDTTGKMPRSAVLRKKCVKCLMHEREIA